MALTYKQLKWFILLIPTITVGVWEYVRHEYLLPYISMDLGNWLTPVIVLFVTFTLLTNFFSKLERIQEELRVERAEKAVLEERERIASDLHDGMAQSLFLLSIKVSQLKRLDVPQQDKAIFNEITGEIEKIHDYVRTGIKNLRLPRDIDNTPWLISTDRQIEQFIKQTSIPVKKNLVIDETVLNAQEKIELSACLGEALINIQKHAQANAVTIECMIIEKEKYLSIQDNGRGFDIEDTLDQGHYGIKMMQERCSRIGWTIKMQSESGRTLLLFSKI